MRYGEAGQSHLLPFLGAAALFAALTITAHSLVLGLAAVIAGPVPAAQTALSLSRRAVSGAAQEAASVAEAAPESTGAAASQPEAAAPTGGIESYLVELLGDDARPEGAGAVIEKNYPQGSGEKYVACGAGSIKNNTRQTAADIAAEIQEPLPFGVEKAALTRRSSSCTPTPPRTTASRRGCGIRPATAPVPPTRIGICVPWAG